MLNFQAVIFQKTSVAMNRHTCKLFNSILNDVYIKGNGSIVRLEIITVKSVLNGPSQKDQKVVFKTNYCLIQLLQNAPFAGQKYWRMLQREHSPILLIFNKLPFVIKIFVLSIFEWPLE